MTNSKFTRRLPTDAETISRSRELIGVAPDEDAIPVLLARHIHVQEAIAVTLQEILAEIKTENGRL